MELSAKPIRPSSRRNGFSLIELLLSLVVLLIITTVAVPVIVRSLQSYQLNSTASQLSGMLKLTKFQAIRQNLPVGFQAQQQGTNWLLWVDINGNGNPDPTEPQMFVGGNLTLLPSSSVPNTGTIVSALGAGSTGVPWTVLPATTTAEWYDHRGVLCFQGAAQDSVCPASPVTIYAIYVGNPNDPSTGYRAIITLPSGAVQVWSASSSGTWQRVS
jgi:type IV fimbrial biogenesis protein FimT